MNKQDGLTRYEQGDRYIQGKVYHWHMNDNQQRSLVAGTVKDCASCEVP